MTDLVTIDRVSRRFGSVVALDRHEWRPASGVYPVRYER